MPLESGFATGRENGNQAGREIAVPPHQDDEDEEDKEIPLCQPGLSEYVPSQDVERRAVPDFARSTKHARKKLGSFSIIRAPMIQSANSISHWPGPLPAGEFESVIYSAKSLGSAKAMALPKSRIM